MSHAALRLGLVGAGSRGTDVYGQTLLSYPERAQLVAVSDPRRERLERIGRQHEVPRSHRFREAREFWTRAPDLDLDAVIIASPDETHHAQVLQATALQLPMLLEKPVANTLGAVQDLRRRLRGYRPPIVVAHVLRYTPFFQTIHTLLGAGRIGKLIHINHTENIGFWHFAHSFVRGNWRQESASSPMVLAKASHDLDILRWLAGAPACDVHAYGALHHFKPSEAPAGSTAHCLDGCAAERHCPYSARRIYLERFAGQRGWPNNVVTPDPTPHRLEEALRLGPYGRCVYRCDNDVLDTYSINILFVNDVTAAFTLTAFTEETTRTLHLVGTHGELHAHMDKGEIIVADFCTRQSITLRVGAPQDGHGGGDQALILAFLTLLERYGEGEEVDSLTTFEESLDAHLMAFQAHGDALYHLAVSLQASQSGRPGVQGAGHP